MKLSEKWEDIPQMVEAIIKARSITSETKTGNVVTTTTRPMRFREVAEEMDVSYAMLYRWIRTGSEPPDIGKTVVFAWCKKHFAAIKTK